MKLKKMLTSSMILAAFLASQSQATVPPEELARLGTELTPIGAIKAGNADGTIPAWTGGITEPPAGYQPGGFHIDPYPEDKILFTITADNVDQYKDNLSPGQIELFKKYPDTWKMNIYPTRRSASFPKNIYDATNETAKTARLSTGGNGVLDSVVGIPFPIPQEGVQVAWNHIMRYRGDNVTRIIAQVSVQKNGNYDVTKFEDDLILRYSERGMTKDRLNNLLFYFRQKTLAPARLSGNVLLVHEPVDQVSEPRTAWVYNAGQRRVRRAPNIAYDAPGNGADGLRTTDNFDMFNGSPDRYEWKILGRKEAYIPYNSYKLHGDTSLDYDDMIAARHLNPDNLRYELHRVWSVSATLRGDARHIYARRDFLVDEDSWQIAIADHYDERGEIWRVAEAHSINYYDVPAHWLTTETLYDLISGRYLATGRLNREDPNHVFNTKRKDRDFTPAALRRVGKR